MEQSTTPKPQPESSPGARRLRLGAVLAVAVVVGFVAWLILKDDDNGSDAERAKPEQTTAADLQNLASEVGHRVYWAGPRAGESYELTRTRDGSIYIRYLPKGVPVGDERPNYLTVGTYPFKNAYATLQKSARREGTTSGSLPKRGIYVVSRERPNSVYLAYRGSAFQIEVFSPSATRARKLVTSGKIRPVG